MTDPCELTLTEAARAIRQGMISSVELVQACLKRIAMLQPVLNAFIAVEAEAALAAAKAADDALARGATPGPLHGVPLAHKDMYYRAGTVTTCGSKIRRHFVPDQTATVLTRLDAAGALTLGRLNMSEFAMGPTGHNAHYGRACNPWHPDCITGGSSSGSGAAVAAGLAFGALGSDTGGSIRLPAAICGVAGLKPTYGRVSRAGAMPLSFSLDCVGPLAPTVADVALLYEVIAGPDPRDPTCVDRPCPRSVLAERRDLNGLRVGVPSRFYDEGLDAEVAAALAESRRTLASLGAEVLEVDLPDQSEIGELANIVAMTEAAALHLPWLQQQPDDYGPQVRARLLQGLAIPGPLYVRALQLRAVMLQAMLDGPYAACDVLHLPVLAFPVPTAADVDVAAGGGMQAMIAGIARCTRTISYLGLPALAQPIGFSRSGLPIGMQLVGRPFEEATVLRVGHAYEQAAGTGRARALPPAEDQSRAARISA